MKLFNKKRGQISIDFLTAVSIFLLTFLFILSSLSGITVIHQRQDTKFPEAERVANLLIKNPGLKGGNDTGWEGIFDENKSKIERIGLSAQSENKHPLEYTTNDTPVHYVLSFHKIDGETNSTLDTEGLMEKHGTNESTFWWEIGEEINQTDYIALRDSLDLYAKYHVYVQIRPLNTSLSTSQADQNSQNYTPNTKNAEKIEKIVYIKRYVEEDGKWVFLKNPEGEVIKYSLLLWMW